MKKTLILSIIIMLVCTFSLNVLATEGNVLDGTANTTSVQNDLMTIQLDDGQQVQVSSNELMRTAPTENTDTTVQNTTVSNTVEGTNENTVSNDVSNEVVDIEGSMYDITDIENEENAEDFEYEMHEGDLYQFEDNITIQYEAVNGNVYLFGENITLEDMAINGNLFILGKDVKLNYVEVYGSLYACASSIDMTAYMLDAYIASGNLTINTNSYVERSVNAFADTVKIAASIYMDCNLIGQNIDLTDAVIEGNLRYTSGKEVNLDSTTVSGEVNANIEKQETETTQKSFLDNFNIMNILSSMIYALFIIGFILLMTKRFVPANQTNIFKNILVCALIGIVSLLLIPLISVLLMTTEVALGLGILLLVVYFIVLFSSLPIVSLAMAASFLKNNENVNKWLALGLALVVALVLVVLRLIPVVGTVVEIIIVAVGLGATVKTIFYSGKRKNKNKKEQSPVQTEESAVNTVSDDESNNTLE